MDGQIRFLALRNNPADPAHGGDFYYVVTGGVDDGETHVQAVIREVKEETGIIRALRLVQLPIEREYHDIWGNDCHELMYALVTDAEVAHLSEEHVEHQWLDPEAFKKTIRWHGSASELADLLDEIENLI
ncbi:MAG: NUDIX domain-containing protein [Microgenomates group bacterium]